MPRSIAFCLCNLCSSQIVLSFTKLTVRLNILLKLPHKLSQVWTIISIHRKFELVKRVISVSTHSQTVIENELWTLQGLNLRPLPCRVYFNQILSGIKV